MQEIMTALLLVFDNGITAQERQNSKVLSLEKKKKKQL